jgi:3D (Asp-Asp-Asp) domain-containing protein
MSRKRKLILAGLIVALGASVFVSHNTKQEEKIKTMQETIDKQQQMIYNKDTMIEDLTVTVKEQHKVVNDLELAKNNLEEEIQKREAQQVSRGGGREIDVEVTFYTHTGNPTASGTMPRVGVTAACNFLALGSHVIINGHEYIIEDTGGMSGNVIDIFVDSEEEALQLGRQYTTATIL